MKELDLERGWRHGGAWFKLRSVFNSSLMILAAARTERVEPPADWVYSVKLALRILECQENEANDVLWMKMILHSLFEDTLGKSRYDVAIRP